MTSSTRPVAKKTLWAGYVLSALPVLMLLMSAVMKFAQPPPVKEGFARLGPVIFGVLIWGGLFLRATRLRALIPLRAAVREPGHSAVPTSSSEPGEA